MSRGATWAPAEALTTASGARVALIDVTIAEAFLARLGETSPPGADVALGAHEDGLLIGVAALATGVERGASLVAVAPNRRRLKVGSDLLHALIGHAAALELRHLSCTRRLPSPGAVQLVRSLGLVVAREVHQHTARMVVVLPPGA